MICHRCQGLMCPCDLRDWAGGKGEGFWGALRCITCGEIVDQVILSNRTRARERKSGLHEKRPRHNLHVMVG